MIALGLEPALDAAYRAALVASNVRVRTLVDVLDQDERPLRSLVVRVLPGGAVEFRRSADVTRSLRLRVYDPHRGLNLDASSPAEGALFADNLLTVRHGTLVGDTWVDVPVFTGPLTKLGRAGDVVELEGQGKDALGLDPHYAGGGYTIKQGRRVDDAIRDVMGRVGERRFDLPVMLARLPRPRAVEPDDEPWDVVKFGWQASEVRYRGRGKKRRRERVDVEYNGLAALAGAFDVFYNGRGYLTARRRTRNPVHTFRAGVDLVDDPAVTWDALAFRNRVVVTGATVTIGKKPNRRQVQLREPAELPPSHPLSPAALARNGVRRPLTEFVSAPNLKTRSACRARARQILAERSRAGVTLAFDALPVPWLEEGDTVRVVTDAYTLDVVPDSWTLPLGPGVMRVGR